MTIDDIIEALKRQRKIWDIQRYYAGPDQPGSIEALQRAGLACVAADNDVKLGVDLVYSLLREARVRFFAGQCPNLLDEIENYHWPEPKDLKPDQDEKDLNPVKQDDHSLDSLRYACVSIAKTRLDKTKPVVPNQTKTPLHELTLEQRLKKLKAKKKAASESW